MLPSMCPSAYTNQEIKSIFNLTPIYTPLHVYKSGDKILNFQSSSPLSALAGTQIQLIQENFL